MSVALIRTTSAGNCITSSQRDSRVTLGHHESKLPNTEPALQDIIHQFYQTQLRLQQIRWNRRRMSWVATGNFSQLLFSEYTWWSWRKNTWGGKEIREQKNWDVSQYHMEVHTDWRRSYLSSCHFKHSLALGGAYMMFKGSDPLSSKRNMKFHQWTVGHLYVFPFFANKTQYWCGSWVDVIQHQAKQ